VSQLLSQWSYARVVHLKAKVASTLTDVLLDVWQQMFEQQDITVIGSYAPFTITSGCMKTTPVHLSLGTPTEADTHAVTRLSETSERRQ